jgi:hypothetical protein
MQLNKLRVFLEDFKTTYEKDIVPPRYKTRPLFSNDHKQNLKPTSSIEKESQTKKIPLSIVDELSDIRISLGSSYGYRTNKSVPKRDANENSIISKSFKISQKRYSAAHKPKIESIISNELREVRNSSRESANHTENIHELRKMPSISGKKENKPHIVVSAFKGKIHFLKNSFRKMGSMHHDNETNESNKMELVAKKNVKKDRIYSVKPPQTFFMSRTLA